MSIFTKKQTGFTIVELMVVIAVIGVLAAVVIVGAGAWRNRVAVNEVTSDLNNAVAAMESARNFGNVYPTSMPTTFTASSGVTFTFVSGDGSNYCIEAKSNSVTSVTYFVKTSDNTKVPRAGTCGSQQPINVADTFSGSGSLGVTETGALAWQPINGTSWSRTSGYAKTTAAIGLDPMAVVDVSKNNYKATLGTTNGGEALYFWVVDQQNWWRLRLSGSDTTTTGGYDAWIYNVWTSQASYNAGNPPTYQNTVAKTQANMDAQMSWCNSNGYVCQNTGQSQWVTTSSTTTAWTMYLDRSVNGTTAAVNSFALSGTNPPTTFGITTSGSTISVFYDSSTLGLFNVGSPNTSSKVGVGLGGTNRVTPNGPTSIAIVDAP